MAQAVGEQHKDAGFKPFRPCLWEAKSQVQVLHTCAAGTLRESEHWILRSRHATWLMLLAFPRLSNRAASQRVCLSCSFGSRLNHMEALEAPEPTSRELLVGEAEKLQPGWWCRAKWTQKVMAHSAADLFVSLTASGRRNAPRSNAGRPGRIFSLQLPTKQAGGLLIHC